MPVKISIENGKICKTDDYESEKDRIDMMRLWISDKTDEFRLDFAKTMERRFTSSIPNMGPVLQRRTNLEFLYSQQLRS